MYARTTRRTRAIAGDEGNEGGLLPAPGLASQRGSPFAWGVLAALGVLVSFPILALALWLSLRPRAGAGAITPERPDDRARLAHP